MPINPSTKSAQDIQDDIFRKMSAEKKIKLTAEFTSALISLNRKNNRNGYFRTDHYGSKDSQ